MNITPKDAAGGRTKSLMSSASHVSPVEILRCRSVLPETTAWTWTSTLVE